MKYSAIILATLAVSSQALKFEDYQDTQRYPFGAPYSTTEIADHQAEMSAATKQVGKKPVAVVQKPVNKEQQKEEQRAKEAKKAAEAKKSNQKKLEAQMRKEQNEWNADIDRPEHIWGKTFEIETSTV